MVTPRAKIFGVEWRISPRQSLEQRVFSVVLEIYPAMLQQSKRQQDAEGIGSCAEAHQMVSSEVEQSGIPGSSAHDESLFHMAESIPEGPSENAEYP